VAQRKLLHNTTLTEREKRERRCDSGLLIVIQILTADDKQLPICPCKTGLSPGMVREIEREYTLT